MRILVIGANGALGSRISESLADSGAFVIGTARSAATASSLPAGLGERLLVDLADDSSIATLGDYLLACGPLGGIVNASGAVGFGAVEETTPAMAAELMRVNHQGPAELVTRLLPSVRAAQGAGQAPFIAAIAGVVAERAFPGMAAYVASKSAHAAWLASLRLELRRDRIRVLVAYPGHTETGLAGRARFGVAPAFPAGHDPDRVASVIVAGIRNGASEIGSGEFDERSSAFEA